MSANSYDSDAIRPTLPFAFLDQTNPMLNKTPTSHSNRKFPKC